MQKTFQAQCYQVLIIVISLLADSSGCSPAIQLSIRKNGIGTKLKNKAQRKHSRPETKAVVVHCGSFPKPQPGTPLL